MEKTIFFHLFRHGQKGVDDNPNTRADSLTNHGARQIVTGFRKHILDEGIMPDVIAQSGMGRTLECAIIAMARCNTIGLGDVHRKPAEPSALGYMWMQRNGLPPKRFYEFETKLRGEHGDNLTFAHWLQSGYGPVWAYMARMTAWMEFSAMQMAARIGGSEAHIVGFSHSPLIESAAPDPTKQTMLRVADMLRYRVVVENDVVKIMQPKIFRCPIENGWD